MAIPFSVDGFGGLNLSVDSVDVGMTGAVDLANVDFTTPGKLVTRPGNTAVKSLGNQLFGNGIASYSSSPGAIPHLIVIYQTTGGVWKLEAYPADGGALIATATPSASTEVRAVRWGDPSNVRLYIADGGGGVWRYNGATFTQLAKGAQYVAVSTRDNRLVYVYTANASRVEFSDAGAPETVGVNNFVDLTPGDGSQITGATTYEGNVYVFKPDRHFIFNTTSTLSDGSPVFGYRTVDRFGALVPPVAGNEGVYFYDGQILWLTTGGFTPRRISAPVEPFLAGRVSLNGVTNTTNGGFERLSYANGLLYVSVAISSSRATLVYNPKTDTWTFYDLPFSGLAEAPNGPTAGDNKRTAYWLGFLNATPLKIYRVDPTATTDDGTAITWRYQTGYSAAGGYFRQRIVSSGERKRHHHVDILGSGTVTHQVLTLNPRVADIADPGGSVTLGTAPALARGYRRRGARGTHIGHKLSGSGPAVVSGFTYWLANVGSDT